jgi:pyruvate/2-oxoglutarate dehydrogenase complex dihydrolipoamide acyltransferase (E2) component
MITKIRMPRVDANVEEGTIGRWLRSVGDRIAEGTPLVEIITDKATFELEAECGGYLRLQAAPPRSVVPVGYVMALVSSDPDEPVPDVSAENEAAMEAYRAALIGGAAPSVSLPAVEPPAAEPRGGVRATPAARRLASEHGLSLADLAARAGGVVQLAHVEDEIRRLAEGGGG